MGTSQPETAGPGTPVILLESSSPYGSRRVTVEYDGLTTAAYLHDDTSVISATWIANHRPAPDSIDQARLDAGRAPLMPAALVKHPGSRGSLQGSALHALWFEEGDGVAILENGQPVAVIAGWSDMDRGMPGYSRDVVGQTPFGWPLDEAMEGLAPRLERSRAYWRWRQSASGWDQFQQALLGHLQARIGPGGHYWDASAGQQPPTGVTERPPEPHRPYTILSTVGMSCQRMPVVEQVLDDPSGYARIELAIATTLPSAQAARVFGLARDLSLARGDLVRPRAQRPLVPRARLVPAGRERGLRRGAAARFARLAERGGVVPPGKHWPARSRPTCPASPSAETRSGGSGSSRSRNGIASWPRNTARPAWSAGSPPSSGAGSPGPRGVWGGGQPPMSGGSWGVVPPTS